VMGLRWVMVISVLMGMAKQATNMIESAMGHCWIRNNTPSIKMEAAMRWGGDRAFRYIL
jgi:hypothetical protein